jgi:hypothetical protein
MLRTTRLALRIISAKQDIVNLGYPEIIARFFYEKYGNLAPLLAKWYKDYRVPQDWEGGDWWRKFLDKFGDLYSLANLTYLYERSGDLESFFQACDWAGIPCRHKIETQEDLDEQRGWLINRIRADFFDDTFFNYYSLIQDIVSGQLKDIAPYKKLRFFDAQKKYEKRRYFQESTPIKVYENGFQWIDVGRKSTLLSEQMKNCGSAGLMSLDKDATIVALFGPNGKPHVMVTYSPNEKRISGDECGASAPVKPEYHQYVIDLAEHLGASFDAMKSKSPELGLKYRLRNIAQSIEPLKVSGSSFDSYFRFVDKSGKVFYTNGAMVVSEEEVHRAQEMMDQGKLKSNYPRKEVFRVMLNANNHRDMEAYGLHVDSLYDFIGGD